MNELSLIFNKLGIDTTEVLEAANTKWNFLPFTPGLVGGHCIGVDPYYLTYKAQEVGYDPKVILAGRRINDEMAIHVSGQIMDKMKKNLTDLSSARVLMLGLTFKENCPDIRNTKVIDIVSDLENKGIAVDIYDPWVDRSLVKAEYNLDCLEELSNKKQYNAIVLAVAHKQFSEYNRDYLKSFMKEDAIIFDVKSLLPREEVDGRI
jgi:UDP-N-acetyl-D-galactosamine dehydrogenase